MRSGSGSDSEVDAGEESASPEIDCMAKLGGNACESSGSRVVAEAASGKQG